MKNMIRSAIILGLVLLFAGTQKASAQNEDVSLQSFYDELSPYGTWIQDPQYGYVWRPDVDQDDFRPYYSNGRWVMTEYGNTWVSNYDWGWAPFHYGRWIYTNYNQWIWLPDTVWGPAWVSWRSGGGYYGWAPLGPSISIGINIGRGGYRVPDMCWSFVPYSNIYYNSYPRYNYGRNRVYIQNTVIINNTYVRNNRTYYTGPRIDDIRRTTNQRVNVYSVNRSHSPGASRIDNNSVNIYQPRSGRSSNSNPAPREVVQGNITRGSVGRDSKAMANRGDMRNDTRSGRDNHVSSQGNRGGDARIDNNRSQGDRSGSYDRGSNSTSRSPITDNNVNGVQRGSDNRVGVSPPSGDNRAVGSRPSVFGRTRDNNSSNAQPQQQNVDRSREIQQQQAQAQQQQQQRAERSREMQQQQAQVQQQRAERSREAQQQQQRVERQPQQQQAPQQRMERPQQQSSPRVERVERSQPQQERSQPQQRSSGNEGRGGEGRGNGRPGRG